MARELPIHNGRMTTDLDANGFKIKNLPPGSGFTQAQADWNQADATAPDFIKNKPTIPAPVAVDDFLTTQGAAADAKAVGDALRGGFTEWEFGGDAYSGENCTVVITGPVDGYYTYKLMIDEMILGYETYTTDDILFIPFAVGPDATITATRHIITPTKTSQLTNDSGFLTSHQDISGKADKAVPSAAGNLAALNAQGNLADSGVKVSDFAAKSDLPYSLVTPGEWEFSGLPEGATSASVAFNGFDAWTLTYVDSGDVTHTDFVGGNENDLELDFPSSGITATRASLPGHLLDRAVNRVEVSGDTTLTLPAANPGYLRDFLVRLEISGSTVPTITFAAPAGETITYETDGDEFPVPDEAGTWLYSFTESCVAHKFAVSLKKVNVVAQGGA